MNASLRHFLLLELYYNGVIKRLTKEQLRTEQRIREIALNTFVQINSSSPLSMADMERIRAAESQILNEVERAKFAFETALTNELDEFTSEEGDIFSELLNMATLLPLLLFRFRPFSQLEIRQIVDAPIAGESYPTRVWRHSSEAQDRIRAAFAQHSLQVVQAGVIANQIAAVYRESFIVPSAVLVETELVRVANQTVQGVYGQNSAVIDVLIWMTQLDRGVCSRCLALQGREFPINTSTRPPRHPRCRCYLVLSLDKKEAIELYLGQQLPDYVKIVSDPARPEVFEKWLKLQNDAFVRLVLNDKQYEYFKLGLPIADAPPNRRSLTLKDIRKYTGSPIIWANQEAA